MVQLAKNVCLAELESAGDYFVKRLTPGVVALVYYSGHGTQIDGANHLNPVDYYAADEADAGY